MRDKLRKEIRKRYGLLFGSVLRREQLHEITCDALSRFDEELENGASEQAAYEAALSSLGDLKEIHKAPVCYLKPVPIVIFAVFCIISALAVTACILLRAWLLLIIVSICMIVAGITLYRILSKHESSKARHIISLILSGAVLSLHALLCLFFLLMIGRSCDAKRNPNIYDYTEHTQQIESICYVEVTHLEYGKETDEFGYDVLETVDDDRKDELLKDLSQLKYVYNPPPSVLHEGERGFLLCFKEGSGDIRYVLYCNNTCTVINRVETGIDIACYSGFVSLVEWNALFDRYLKQDW